MSVSQLPAGTRSHMSVGDARLQLSLSLHGKLVLLVSFTDTAGRLHVIDLTPGEAAALANDIATVCNASREQIMLWHAELDLGKLDA